MKGQFDQDWQCWLRLLLVPGLGNQNARKLLGQFGLPQDIFEAKLEDLKACVSPKIANAIKQALDERTSAQLSTTAAWLQQDGNSLVYLGHSSYPIQLLEIPDPPLMLYVKGDLSYLNKPILAVVGSRNATQQGKLHAEAFSQALSSAGWCISSGLAAGVDTAAHLGGLSGAGGTIAVIGTGIDIVYPARNRQLAHQIVEHGCIVSEYHLGTGALAANFPRRNRIISGLARGVLVVEAAAQSGSLITARMAAEQGREVFAIPGSIHSPLARGCHQLIKQGAKLVESAQDVLEEFADISTSSKFETQTFSTHEEMTIDTLLAHIGYDPIQIDTLVALSGIEISELSARVFALEMQGVLETLPGGMIQRIS